MFPLSGEEIKDILKSVSSAFIMYFLQNVFSIFHSQDIAKFMYS